MPIDPTALFVVRAVMSSRSPTLARSMVTRAEFPADAADRALMSHSQRGGAGCARVRTLVRDRDRWPPVMDRTTGCGEVRHRGHEQRAVQNVYVRLPVPVLDALRRALDRMAARGDLEGLELTA